MKNWGNLVLMIFGFLFGVLYYGAFAHAEVENGGIFFEGGYDEGKLAVDVKFRGMKEAVMGLGFHLDFDEEVLKFVGFEEGDVFERGGDKPVYLVEGGEGQLVVGVSLKRGDVLAAGDGRVLRLLFKAGDGVLVGDDFERVLQGMKLRNPVVAGIDGNGRFDLEGVEWVLFNNRGEVDFGAGYESFNGENKRDGFSFWDDLKGSSLGFWEGVGAVGLVGLALVAFYFLILKFLGFINLNSE